ncbi:MAG TPA: aspartyl-phosphate phosphatase Spo0E family protein [Candidatus Pseudogracilibacillus intestinigallinarum]|uniref:Aspartyl-phosphate phosphatase Spo0E family protein n=1 Tax=Candidatus Pseudogracilibacillus intestinigallinarum TaxID=2838742 RepID=A0A9D1PNA3_9BACI|nr:aspartyl-phosphate phosphatase Spo0E family protein [Candidatus Pseudogracilibacillus intestinigallinarum]
MTKDKLLHHIERYRNDLIEIVQLKGMTSEEAIEKSQALDHLLNKYNQYFTEESQQR